MSIGSWLLLAFALVLVAALLYWLLITTEGTYLGQPIVTWMYDLVAKRYDTIKGFDEETESIYLGRPVVASLRGRPAPLVLDIGTGTGRLPLTLLNQPHFQGRVIGLDASQRMLELAAEKLAGYGDRCLLIHRSAMTLPFNDASMDAVTLLEMLEFTPNPKAVLQEAVRVLKPSGVFVTTRRRGIEANLMPGKTFTEVQFCKLLADLGLERIQLQRWQVDYDLVWAVRAGNSRSGTAHPLEVLRCPQCTQTMLVQDKSSLICESCGAQSTLAQHKSGLICENCGAQLPSKFGIIQLNS